MDEYINKFIENESSKGISQLTLNSYLSDIKLFLSYLRKREIDLLVLNEEEVKNQVKNYKNYLLKENYKATTINRKLLSINKLLRVIGKESTAELLKIHKAQTLEDVISVNEVNRLLGVCNNKRDRAIILTLSKMGLRVSEVLELKVTDVYGDSVEFKGKRGKYRTVVIPNKVKKVWLDYLVVRPECDSEQLFIGKRGPIKRQAVNTLLLKYQKKARVKRKKVHPHNFRHSCFKTLSDLGVSIEVIADIAGHESLDTTRIYTRRTKEELKKIMDY